MSMFKRPSKLQKQSLRQKDPHIRRETAKYGFPLPSREHILMYFCS